MRWNKLVIAVLSFLLSTNVFAQNIYAEPLLNKITYFMSAEKWAATKTAKITISVDATLDKLGLANANSHILQNLQKLAAGEWHITMFNRSQDKSGLEQLHVEAEARLNEKDLANVREAAKKISRPGETYTVVNIDFVPSNEELEQTHAAVRAVIYNNAKQEVARLNELYPDLHYFLYSIDFINAQMQPLPTPTRKMATFAAMSEATNLSVSAKVVENAVVVIGARTPELTKAN